MIIVVVQLPSQAPQSFTVSQSLLKFMSIELVMLPNHLIPCCPLLHLPSVFPSIRVFSSELVLHIRWPRNWSFSFSKTWYINTLIKYHQPHSRLHTMRCSQNPNRVDDGTSTLVIAEKPQTHLPWPTVGAGFYSSCNSSGKPLGTKRRDTTDTYSKRDQTNDPFN